MDDRYKWAVARDGTSAGTAPPGRWALDSVVGDMRPVFFGGSIRFRRPLVGESRVRATAPEKDSGGRRHVHGASGRSTRRGLWRAQRKAWSTDMRIAALRQRFQPGCSGREGGLGRQGTDHLRSMTSTRREGRMSCWHIHAFRAVRCCSNLMRANRGHSAARLLQSCLRHQCRPASAAGEAYHRLMGLCHQHRAPLALQDLMW